MADGQGSHRHSKAVSAQTTWGFQPIGALSQLKISRGEVYEKEGTPTLAVDALYVAIWRQIACSICTQYRMNTARMLFDSSPALQVDPCPHRLIVHADVENLQ